MISLIRRLTVLHLMYPLVFRNKLFALCRRDEVGNSDEAIDRRMMEHEEVEGFADQDERKIDEGRWTNNGRKM